MSRGMLQRLAAVLLLLCLPVAAEGAETIPEQADPCLLYTSRCV